MTDSIPDSAAAFYRLRDDRTDAVLDDLGGDQHYQNATLLVAADADRAATPAGQVCLLTLANLLSRFARDVDLAIPDVSLDPALQRGQPRLPDHLFEKMAAADPYGAFDRGRTRPATAYDGAIVLGNAEVDIEPVVRVDASGWLARLTRNERVPPFQTRDDNPIGPGIGACLAVAELFKSLVSLPSRLHTAGYTFDAFRLDVHPLSTQVRRPPVPDAVRLGEVHLVGVGSVGSALLYFLRRLPIQGQVELVDCDVVEPVNLNRSPLFTAEQAAARAPKVAVGQEYLAGHLPVTGHHMPYREFVDTVQEGSPDVIIPVANEYGVRATIQFNRPPVMVHTTTGGSRVYVRRHIPIADPCLLCHFPPDEAGFSPDCATAPVAQPPAASGDDRADAALPFVSVMAGALLAGELVKLTLDDYPVTRDFVELDMFSTFSEAPLAYDWQRQPDCPFCTTQNEAVHRRLIEDTRFAHLAAPDTHSN